jgi:hypothetical protein
MRRTIALNLSQSEWDVIERLAAARKMSPDEFARVALRFPAQPVEPEGEWPLGIVPPDVTDP